METASLYIQKVGVVLPGTMSHVIISDTRKAPCVKGKVRMLIKLKFYYSRTDVLNLKINLNDNLAVVTNSRVRDPSGLEY